MKNSTRTSICVLALAGMGLAACGPAGSPGGPPSLPPSPPPTAVNSVVIPPVPSTEQLVFHSSVGESDGSHEIYRMNANGSDPIRLTTNDSKDSYPIFSNDGMKILYTCGTGASLCQMDPDGFMQEELWTWNAPLHSSSGSPDGELVSFHAVRGYSGLEDIVRFNLTTGSSGLITNTPNLAGTSPAQVDTDAVWHPGGGLVWVRDNRIVFKEAGTNQILPITDADFASVADPDVSSDGTKIAFAGRLAPQGPRELFVYDFGTGAITALPSPGDEATPSWSPDGTKIAYSWGENADDEGDDIYVMSPDGTNRTQLTFTPDHTETEPDWGTPPILASIADVEQEEGSGGNNTTFAFDVTLSQRPTGSVQVTFDTVAQSAAAGVDFIEPSSVQINFLAGELTKTVDVTVVGDDDDETNESFVVELISSVGARLSAKKQGHALILDDDAAPTASPTASASPSPTPSASPSGSPTPTPSPSVSGPVGPPGQIAFRTDRMSADDSDIWIMDTAGNNARALTSGSFMDGSPQLSPDSQTVLFHRSTTGAPDIYRVPSAGGPVTFINGTSGGVDVDPGWSPDGGAIIWVGTSSGGAWLVEARPPDAPPQTLIDEPGDEAQPDWGVLANGDEAVAFHVQDPTDPNASTLKIRVLTARATTDLGSGCCADMNEDGTHLVFSSDRLSRGNFDIYSLDLTQAGAAPVRLTTAVGNDGTPAWSPDGRSIAFTSHRDGNAEIYRMSASGADQVNISNNPTADDFEPTWGLSPVTTTSSSEGTDVRIGVVIPLLLGLLLRRRRRLLPDTGTELG